jgi:hypothetical protein
MCDICSVWLSETVTVPVLRSVARIGLVKTNNTSACATVNYKVCKSAIALYWMWLRQIVTKVLINPIIRTGTRHFRRAWEYKIYFNIFLPFTRKLRSRDSAVGIATGFWLDGRGVRIPVRVGSRFFSSPPSPDGFSGSLSLLSNMYQYASGSLSLGIKRQGREAEYSI